MLRWTGDSPSGHLKAGHLLNSSKSSMLPKSALQQRAVARRQRITRISMLISPKMITRRLYLEQGELELALLEERRVAGSWFSREQPPTSGCG